MPRISISRHGKAVVEGDYCGECQELRRNNPGHVFPFYSCKFWPGPLYGTDEGLKRCPECLACDQPQGPQWKDAPDQEGWWWYWIKDLPLPLSMPQRWKTVEVVYSFGGEHLYAFFLWGSRPVKSIKAIWYGPIPEPPAENGR